MNPEPHGAHRAVDPDVDRLRDSRPLHLRGRYLYVVLVGGMLGTTARWAVGEWLPARHGFPVGTLVANLAGALLLGMLLEFLTRHAPDQGWPRLARLHFGTGFCGAFTTMSTLAVETDLLLRGHHAALALTYLAASLAAGIALAAFGIWLAGRVVPVRHDQQGAR